VKKPEQYIDDILAGSFDVIDLFAPPLEVVSSLLRGCLVARPGRILRVADYNAVEARVLNWCAGQEDVVDLFRRGDAAPKAEKAKYDAYRHMAVAMGRAARPDDIANDSDDRQAGKAAELGCGYQMGWEKFISAAWVMYQVRVTEEQAKIAVKAYRDSHPNVVQWWWDLNRAAMDAVLNPGSVHTAGVVRFTKRGGGLWLILPSGRPLFYPRARIEDKEMPWGEVKPSVAYDGVNSFTRQWEREFTYGGKLAENVVQAVSRDLLREGMFRCEEEDYPVILHAHDEIVSETDPAHGSVQEFEELVATTPLWAPGLPLVAEGWEGRRYRK